MKQDVSRGHKRSPNSWTTRHVISFPDDMYENLQRKAREEKTSFNDVVLTRIVWGMESARESEEDENAPANRERDPPIIGNLTRPNRILDASKKRLLAGSSYSVLARPAKRDGS